MYTFLLLFSSAILPHMYIHNVFSETDSAFLISTIDGAPEHMILSLIADVYIQLMLGSYILN